MPQGPYTHERIHFGADADSTALASQTPPKKISAAASEGLSFGI
jgi:hypothetical protein